MSKRPNPELIGDDAPEWTDADFAKAKRLHEMPESLQRLVRGRPKLAAPRVAVSLRMPPDTLAAWKATGAGWQTRMVEVLAAKAPHGKTR